MPRPRLALLIACVVLPLGAAGDARADAYYYEPTRVAAPKDDFWREVVAPHGDEIAIILEKARQAYNSANLYVTNYDDPTGEFRSKLLDDAYGMLRYARRLDPSQPDVLTLLGTIAEESGRASAAVEAFGAYLSLLEPDDAASTEVQLRLGRAYMRLGRWDDAIRNLRGAMSQGTSSGFGALALAYLGNSLMATGRMADAIDVLTPGKTIQNYWSLDGIQVSFTLAVAYDRDEQISAAFEVLETLQNQLQTSFPMQTHQALLQLSYVPASDQHYYLGLFYESLGYLQEARAEWLMYAQGDGLFRQRALDHAAACDELLADKLKEHARPPKPATTTGPAPYWVPYQPYGGYGYP